jgi:hypothetical protein
MLGAVDSPRRSPLSEIHDRERKRRILRCLRDGRSLLDPEDDELATRQAEWDSRRRNPWRWVLHGAVLVAGVVALGSAIADDGSLGSAAVPGLVAVALALGLFEEWRTRRRARRWLGRQGIFRDPSPLG